ncbi:MAG: rhomboid family intrarane serine protease [Blastococcus sp.]|nr:rhomboid family intrarane serine protease [Blastococcus sp.]
MTAGADAVPRTTVRPDPAALLRRNPVTLGLLVVLVVTTSWGNPRRETRAAFGAGLGQPPWGLLTSAAWCAGTLSCVGTLIAVAVLLGPAERRLGSRTALPALVAGQVLGTLLGLASIWALRATGDPWARLLSATVVVGPMPGVLTAAGLAVGRAPALWRRRLRVSVSISLVALVLYGGTAGDVVRLGGWVLGVVAGTLLGRRADGTTPAHSTRREGRALVALVVAVAALGPLMAAVSGTPGGPWAVVSHLFVSTRPPHGLLRAVCGRGGDVADCAALQAHARLTGHGPALLSILPVLLQLVLAEGLRRGRHAAWVGAVTFSAVLTGVGATIVLTVLRTPKDEFELLAQRPGTLSAASTAALLVAPLSVLVLLLITRDRFLVHAGPGAVRRWLTVAGIGLAGLAVIYVVAGSVMSSEWARRASPAALLLDLPLRMLPPGYLGELPIPLVARDEGSRILADWTGVAAWTALLLTAARLIRPRPPTGDAARARALVDRFGENGLSFITTWTGNRYWLPPDGSAVVAYRVIGGVALTTGDPVGPPEVRMAAVRGFTSWCEEQGWTPCWFSVTDEVVHALAGTGAQQLQVAAETWLPLGDLSFSGRRWQDVRTALNRATREGLEYRWISWSQAPLALREKVARLSEEWLADKGLPEMGFTLGGLDELTDPAVRCLLAVDRDGRVSGLTSWLPAHRDGATVGWTLDVMRRARTASPGVMEFLIATAALTFQDEGAEWVSLSGAPLALPPESAGRGMLTRLLELAGRTMEPVYGFRSLLAFKAKFQPRYRPLWLVCPGRGDLPRIARAVSVAYLPEVSAGQALRLVRMLMHNGHRPGRPLAPENVAIAAASAVHDR